MLAALCLLLLVVALVWGLQSAFRWAGESAEADSAMTEAQAKLRRSVDEFVRLIGEASAASYPSTEQIQSAAASTDLAVALVGFSEASAKIWATGVARAPEGHGSSRDVWACFAVHVERPGTSSAIAEAIWPEGGCGGTAVPESLWLAMRRLDQRDSLLRFGDQFTTGLPSGTEIEEQLRSIDDVLTVVDFRVDEAVLTVDAVGKHGIVVLGPSDSYLYGLRMTAGPLTPGPQVAEVNLPSGLDETLRRRAVVDGSTLLSSRESLVKMIGSGAVNAVWLDRELGQLITLVGYRSFGDALTLQVAVEVVEGGWGARAADPSARSVLACFAVTVEGRAGPEPVVQIEAEPCGYPLVGPIAEY